MRIVTIIVLTMSSVMGLWSCAQNTGCTEPTADNYDLNATDDDGTCIPARDKIIGNYSYTRSWTDTATQGDTIDFGILQITEANTASNGFVANFNGQLILHGSVSANNLVFDIRTDEFSQYQGTGTWLTSDSVDLVLNITRSDLIMALSQPFVYYCSKSAQ